MTIPNDFYVYHDDKVVVERINNIRTRWEHLTDADALWSLKVAEVCGFNKVDAAIVRIIELMKAAGCSFILAAEILLLEAQKRDAQRAKSAHEVVDGAKR